ncbi:unnamed protein product [Ceutorhynchus assimilis]|uniref:asparagine--tRNA ligase n=1 Tax=Ceutorhynchus assimilis TaxID=467358 RepID=A0A9N9QKF8_9CUCU|nr:unnamed protein product [Ceutorhynchus assimilis]
MYKRLLNRLLISHRNYSYSRSIIDIIKTGQIGETISVQGWIKSLRKQKEVTFIDINDGSTPTNLQIVLTQKSDSKISVGSSISTSGVLKQSPKGQNEVSAENMVLIGECDLAKGYPFAPRKQYEPEYIREHLHFRPRTRKFASLLRLRHAANISIHNYLDEKGYFNIHTPIMTSNDCEGAGEIFKVLPDNEKLLKSMAKENQASELVYFDTKAYLTVSGQLHLEAAAQALNKVYCFGPTFRAENSKSRFHLSEFYMLELEQAFLSNLDDLLIIVEDLIKSVTSNLLQKYSDDIGMCTQNKVSHKWIDKPFIKISYKEALNILSNKLNKTVKGDIVKEHELALTEYFDQVPVFVINWPKNQKPFYMKEIDNENVAAFDLLAPQIGEIAGGSLREDNYDKLKSRLANNNSQLDWYLDLRRFGCVPTGGFGLGFERFLQFVLGIDTVRDSIPFPRWPHNCKL